MNPFHEIHQALQQYQTRRAFLGRAAHGVGKLALASLLNPVLLSAASASSQKSLGVVNPFHYPQRAKRVIWLTMAGGPSHLETFDPKPKLGEMNGQPFPESITRGKQIAQLQGQKLLCFAPQYKFAKFGKNQTEICELFPQIGSIIDEICLVRSMTTEAINHDPAHMFMNTGSQIAGRPSMGSWAVYGLGTESQDLPGFVVLTSLGRGGQNQPIAARQWSSGLLPSKYQGVHLRGKGDPVLYLGTPKGVTRDQQHDVVNAINAINAKYDTIVDDPEISTRIAQYEMAFKMQASVPELMDINSEPQRTLELYGCQPGDGSFASNCLLARRLAERGVRFIQLYHKDWDHHGGIKEGIKFKAEEIDRACMALVTDLKQRGMLDETLIVWAGEFGRTPMSQGGDGRDHHNAGFSIWLAGAGVKPGFVFGATDEFGYSAIENPVDVHDLHATMLYLMGIEHTRLFVKFQGLDVRLTGIAGKRINEIVA
ncbi:MAG: sulfatase [Verrucomicrobia bacterium SCN 57-15]|nr:MAG: sulfatase [Verrucomicrobia bacterium SCN 57-15]